MRGGERRRRRGRRGVVGAVGDRVSERSDRHDVGAGAGAQQSPDVRRAQVRREAQHRKRLVGGAENADVAEPRGQRREISRVGLVDEVDRSVARRRASGFGD